MLRFSARGSLCRGDTRLLCVDGARPRDRRTTQDTKKFPPLHVNPQRAIVSGQLSALIGLASSCLLQSPDVHCGSFASILACPRHVRLGGNLGSLVERFFNKIKQSRRIATRYDKLAANYLAFVKLAAIRIWLRAYESTPKSSWRHCTFDLRRSQTEAVLLHPRQVRTGPSRPNWRCV